MDCSGCSRSNDARKVTQHLFVVGDRCSVQTREERTSVLGASMAPSSTTCGATGSCSASSRPRAASSVRSSALLSSLHAGPGRVWSFQVWLQNSIGRMLWFHLSIRLEKLKRATLHGLANSFWAASRLSPRDKHCRDSQARPGHGSYTHGLRYACAAVRNDDPSHAHNVARHHPTYNTARGMQTGDAAGKRRARWS